MIGQSKSRGVTCSNNVHQLYGHGLQSRRLNEHHLTGRTVTEQILKPVKKLQLIKNPKIL